MERIQIIREVDQTTMCTKILSIFLGLLLVHSAIGVGEIWHKSQGVPAINCPLDDDPDDPTQLPYIGDCTKFIKCSYGLGYTLSCPRGLHWSKALNRCDSPRVANCNSNEITEKPTRGGNGCTYNFRPHPECDKFVQCVDGQEIILDCTPGTYWDRNNNKCVFDQNVCKY